MLHASRHFRGSCAASQIILPHYIVGDKQIVTKEVNLTEFTVDYS